MRAGVRKNLHVDPVVQRVLLRRVTLYWTAAVLIVALAFIVPTWLHGDNSTNSEAPLYWSLAGLILLLPLTLWDMLRLSQRFVGPVARLREQMRRVAEGQEVPPLHFREEDYWQQMAEEFSAVAARTTHLEYRLAREPEPFSLSMRDRFDLSP